MYVYCTCATVDNGGAHTIAGPRIDPPPPRRNHDGRERARARVASDDRVPDRSVPPARRGVDGRRGRGNETAVVATVTAVMAAAAAADRSVGGYQNNVYRGDATTAATPDVRPPGSERTGFRRRGGRATGGRDRRRPPVLSALRPLDAATAARRSRFLASLGTARPYRFRPRRSRDGLFGPESSPP